MMALKPIDLEFFNQKGVNVHEAIVAASKRARQVNEEIKIEFNQRVELITTKTETESEENDVNPDQLKIAMEFEKRAKPTDVALDELMDGKLGWRYREREEPEPQVEEEPTTTDEGEEE
jgi:DNA-directed RNA polymerase subunit K/omega